MNSFNLDRFRFEKRTNVEGQNAPSSDSPEDQKAPTIPSPSEDQATIVGGEDNDDHTSEPTSPASDVSEETGKSCFFFLIYKLIESLRTSLYSSREHFKINCTKTKILVFSRKLFSYFLNCRIQSGRSLGPEILSSKLSDSYWSPSLGNFSL